MKKPEKRKNRKSKAERIKKQTRSKTDRIRKQTESKNRPNKNRPNKNRPNKNRPNKNRPNQKVKRMKAGKTVPPVKDTVSGKSGAVSVPGLNVRSAGENHV